jgi:hypothetical protein
MRCLFNTLIGLFGLVALLVGGYLLYTVYLNQPDSVSAVLGGASALASDVAEADGTIPLNADGNLTDATTTINPEPVSVDSARASRNNTLTDEETITQAREGATAVISPEAVNNTLVQTNPVLQNEIINADSATTLVFPRFNVNEVQTINTPGPVTFESRVAELEWPEVFRQGEPGAVRVTLRALEDGDISVEAEIPSNTVVATPILIVNRYETHNARVRVRINAPNFDVHSVNSDIQDLEPGSEVSWRWDLTPQKTGNFVITIGVEVTWRPKDPAGEVIGPLPVWGQSVQTRVDQVFGLISIPTASTAGTILAVVGAVAEIPFMAELLSALWQRFMRRVRGEEDNQRSSGGYGRG